MQGSRFVERILTAVTTLRQLGQDVLNYLAVVCGTPSNKGHSICLLLTPLRKKRLNGYALGLSAVHVGRHKWSSLYIISALWNKLRLDPGSTDLVRRVGLPQRSDFPPRLKLES